MNNMVVLESLDTSHAQKVNFIEKLWEITVDSWGMMIGVFSVIVQVVLAILAFCAFKVATETWRSNKENVNLQREAIERAYRPMMVAEYVKLDGVPGIMSIVIKNLGNTLAKNVHFEFDPPIPNVDIEEEIRKKKENKEYLHPYTFFIHRVLVKNKYETWIPGQKLSCIFWKAKEGDFEYLESVHGIPQKQKVTIKYEDEKGKNYSDDYVLSPIFISGEVFSPTSDKSKIKELKNISKELKQISRSLKKFETVV